MPAPSNNAASSGGGGGGLANSSSSSTGGGTNGLLVCSNEACGIRDVWASNLEEEFRSIIHVVQKYNYVAMVNTLYITIVKRLPGTFANSRILQTEFRCSKVLKIWYLGLPFLSDVLMEPMAARRAQCMPVSTLGEEQELRKNLVAARRERVQLSEIVLEAISSKIKVPFYFSISFPDDPLSVVFGSGYDFGYMLKLLTDQHLPSEESEFFELLRIYFPAIYDVKYLMKSCKNLKGGLQEVAEQLELERIGPQHQAGSDSLLTGAAFFKMREMFFEDNIDDAKYCGHLYGLGTSYVMNGNSYHEDASPNNAVGGAVVGNNAAGTVVSSVVVSGSGSAATAVTTAPASTTAVTVSSS
ncbi:unnamed protein product [Ixodes hexagonus]